MTIAYGPVKHKPKSTQKQQGEVYLFFNLQSTAILFLASLVKEHEIGKDHIVGEGLHVDFYTHIPTSSQNMQLFG